MLMALRCLSSWRGVERLKTAIVIGGQEDKPIGRVEQPVGVASATGVIHVGFIPLPPRLHRQTVLAVAEAIATNGATR